MTVRRHTAGIVINGKIMLKLTWNKYIYKFNVLLTVHRDKSVQLGPTGFIVHFQFISIINLYTFRAGLLLIIMRYSVYRAIGICNAEDNGIV
jgi:hypothetical protein